MNAPTDKIHLRELLKRSAQDPRRQREVLQEAGPGGLLRVTVPTAAAALAAFAGIQQAHALPSTEWGPGVNDQGSHPNFQNGGVLLVEGARPNEFEMSWSLDDGRTFTRKGEVLDDPSGNGDIIINWREAPQPVTGLDSTGNPMLPASYIPLPRSNGRKMDVAIEASSTLSVDSLDRWQSCGSSVVSMHPSRNAGEVKLQTRIAQHTRTTRVPIDATDFCATATQNTDPSEATPSNVATSPEAGNLVAHTLGNPTGARTSVLRFRVPTTGALQHLDRSGGATTLGTWSPESPQRGNDDGLGYVTALIKLQTPAGREIYLMNHSDNIPAPRRAFKIALEPTGAAGIYAERQVTETTNYPPVIDSDGDGIPDSGDSSPWRTAPPPMAGMSPPDLNANGIDDVVDETCGPNGTDDFAVNMPVNPNTLIVCDPEPGWPVVRQLPGVMLRSNMPITVSQTATTRPDGTLVPAGSIIIQPGQILRYTHFDDARFPPSVTMGRLIFFPDGSSVDIQTLDTNHTNGQPGVGTFTFKPYLSGGNPSYGGEISVPLSTPMMSGMAPMNNGNAVVGASLGLEGSDVIVAAGSQNLPVTYAQQPVDGGNGDSETDGGMNPDAASMDAMPNPDASAHPDATPADVITLPDGTVLDAAALDALLADAPQINPDAPSSNADGAQTAADAHTADPADAGAATDTKKPDHDTSSCSCHAVGAKTHIGVPSSKSSIESQPTERPSLDYGSLAMLTVAGIATIARTKLGRAIGRILGRVHGDPE